MLLSREARLVSAITLLVIPAIMYGGWTLLGILTHGTVSANPNVQLDETQWALWRAGHAHAGVWTILSLLLQIFLDSARLSAAAKWLARVAERKSRIKPRAVSSRAVTMLSTPR